MFIDSHIHLSHPSYSTPFLYYSPATHSLSTTTRSNLIEEFRSAKISAVIEPAIELESNERLFRPQQRVSRFCFPGSRSASDKNATDALECEKAG